MPDLQKYEKENTGDSNRRVLQIIVSLAAFIVVFAAASLPIGFIFKVLISLAAAAAQIVFISRKPGKSELPEVVAETEPVESSEEFFDDDTDYKLQALEEASQFFGASLKPGDMFRLVASRINELTPFANCVLFIADKEESKLKLVFAAGAGAEAWENLEIKLSDGLAGKAFDVKDCLLENGELSDRKVFPAGNLTGIGSAIAAPLYNQSEVFGVLELFSGEESYGESSRKLLEAIGERLSPLVLSSLAFEKNLSNALTDSLTNLPNERAFYLVLENQIAESQRNRNERPLTVLAIDIKNFGEINRKFGHSTGDNILFFAGEIIKNQLRRMDFLARSKNDEYLTVLPTASAETAHEVVERIVQIFETNPFEISPKKQIVVKLNFGAATFWEDGETPEELLKTAQVRKRRAKDSDDKKVIQFPVSK